MSTLTISQKGWVVIPSALRKKYALTAGKKVHIVDYGGVLALVPLVDDPIQQARGMLQDGSSLTKALITEHQKEMQGD